MRTAILLALSVLALLSPRALAADDPTEAAMAAYDTGQYLQATDKLAAVAFDDQGRAGNEFAFQMWRQVSVTVSNELDLAQLDKAKPPYSIDTSWDHDIAAAAGRDAIREIVRRAKSTHIVILNEAHDNPRDRAFAWRVARALRPLGYSVLAAEAFDNEVPPNGRLSAVDQLIRDGSVRLETGFYTRDPVFASFLRNAMAIGYKPAAYEQTSQQQLAGTPSSKRSIAAREQAEADNLAKLLRRTPGAKILIYVGHSHVAEAPLTEEDGGTTEWMAARLKRMTGIDPLTIDQTTVTELFAPTRQSYISAAFRIGKRDGVLFKDGNPLVLGQYRGAVDLQVVHPRRAYRDGRPTWLADLGGKPLAIASNLLPFSGRRLVQAFFAGTPTDAVPFDQVIVDAGHPRAMLVVPEGKIRFAIQQ